MRKKTAFWFEAKVRYTRNEENGAQKKVSETYVVEAITFGDAEETIIKEITPLAASELNIRAVAVASYGDILFSEDANADKWYKVKVSFASIDERTGNKRLSPYYYLTQASSVGEARSNIVEDFRGSCIDYEINTIAETKITYVFEKNINK